MTMSVAAIVRHDGVASFRYVTNSIESPGNQRCRRFTARARRAIKEGATSLSCSTTGSTGCSTATTWQSGWMVFSDRPTWAPTIQATPSECKARSPTWIRSRHRTMSHHHVQSRGLRAGIAAAPLITLHDSTGTTAGLAVWPSHERMMSSMKHGDTVNGVTCN